MASVEPKQPSYDEKRDDVEIGGSDVASEPAQENGDLHRGLEARQISMIALVSLVSIQWENSVAEWCTSRAAQCTPPAAFGWSPCRGADDLSAAAPVLLSGAERPWLVQVPLAC